MLHIRTIIFFVNKNCNHLKIISEMEIRVENISKYPKKFHKLICKQFSQNIDDLEAFNNDVVGFENDEEQEPPIGHKKKIKIEEDVEIDEDEQEDEETKSKKKSNKGKSASRSK